MKRKLLISYNIFAFLLFVASALFLDSSPALSYLTTTLGLYLIIKTL